MKQILIDTRYTFFDNVILYHRFFSMHKKYFVQETPELEFIESKDGIPCLRLDEFMMSYTTKSDVICLFIPEGIYHAFSRVRKFNKNKKYIILAFGWWDVKKYDLGFEYELIHWHYWINDIRREITYPENINFFADKDYTFETEKENLFCAYATDTNPHRNLLFKELVANFKNTKCSVTYTRTPLIGNNLLDAIHKFKNIKKIDFCVPDYDLNRLIPIEFYNTFNFHLVVETSYIWGDSFTLSEKTVKPLLLGMPFVAFATPGFLKHIRSLGFKTYASLWSEEYDDIVDSNERIYAIIKLIKDLHKFDWGKNKQELQQIAQHNKLNFMYNAISVKESLEQAIRVFTKIL